MSKTFEKQKNPDGTKNSKYVDLLDEDKAISGQKFACLSFVSPDKILEQKNHFFFERFLKYWDFSKCIKKSTQFINFLCYKNNIDFDDTMKEFEDFISTEKDNLVEGSIREEYQTFLDKREDELELEFNESNSFQTSVRGLKVRGVYSSQAEAELRCKMLREVDPNHNVYVGPVGMWMPWDPDAYKTGRVEYLEEELNNLMREKNDNDTYAKQEFDNRVMDTKKNAINENIKLAKTHGNKLTQNVTNDGELIGAGNNTIEKSLDELGKNNTMDDVEKKLFESDNINTSRTKKGDSPRTARKKMVEYYTNLDKEENDGENINKLTEEQRTFLVDTEEKEE